MKSIADRIEMFNQTTGPEPLRPVIVPTNVPTYGLRPMNGGPYRGKPFDFYNVERYSYTPKLNGWQVLAHAPSLACFNRQGEPLSIADEFEDALAWIHDRFDGATEWLVCEGLSRRHGFGRGTLVVLDLIPDGAYRNYSRDERSLMMPPSRVPLLRIGEEPQPNSVYQLESFGYSGLDNAWKRMQEVNSEWGCDFYEGVVAARGDAAFPFNLRNPEETSTTHVKHRWKF